MISPRTCQPHLQAIENECGLTSGGLKVALNQKGLRRNRDSSDTILDGLKVALNQKGLRPVCSSNVGNY